MNLVCIRGKGGGAAVLHMLGKERGWWQDTKDKRMFLPKADGVNYPKNLKRKIVKQVLM